MKALATLILTGLALGLLRLALRPVRRCDVCGEVMPDADPLDAVAVCSWHWGEGGDA